MNSCIFAASGIDLKQWTMEEIKLSEKKLTFRVPGGHSQASAPLSTIRSVNLDSDLSNDKPMLAVYNHKWDFDVGFFKGVMGSLNLVIAVGRCPDDYPRDLTSLENLELLFRRELERRYMDRNERMRREGKDRFIITVPETYKLLTLNGREWLVYPLGGMFDQTYYVLPLSQKYYLRVTFDFVDNTRGHKSDWRQQAQEVADKITASMEIRHDTK